MRYRATWLPLLNIGGVWVGDLRFSGQPLCLPGVCTVIFWFYDLVLEKINHIRSFHMGSRVHTHTTLSTTMTDSKPLKKIVSTPEAAAPLPVFCKLICKIGPPMLTYLF